MRLKEVKEIQGGEVLAEPVYSKNKEILIPKGAILKSEYAELLTSLNIECIQIEDILWCYEKPLLLITSEKKKEYVERVKRILESHIYTGKDSLQKIEVLARDMLEEISVKDTNLIYDISEENVNLYEHTVMVTVLSLMTAIKLGLTKEVAYNIAVGCLLHDLGLRYITISYVNLNFEIASAADVFEYKKHTILAYTVLEEERWIPRVSKNMILSHHEKIDGSGFPLKQKNQETECRIIQMCDTFDCLISGMECTRNTVSSSIECLSSQVGIKYDEFIVNTFVSFVARYPVGTEVELSNGKFGIISSQLTNPKKPKIVLLNGRGGEVQPDGICNLEKESSILIRKVIQ